MALPSEIRPKATPLAPIHTDFAGSVSKKKRNYSAKIFQEVPETPFMARFLTFFLEVFFVIILKIRPIPRKSAPGKNYLVKRQLICAI